MFVRGFFTLFLSALFVANAIAAEITLHKGLQADHISYIGEMNPDDYAVFLNTLNEADKQKQIFVYFNSPGGDLDIAVKMGHAIRQQNIGTYIPENSQCYSACFFAYIGGATRSVSDTGKLGVHQFYGGKGSADYVQSTTQYITSILLEYTAQMGVDIETMKLAFQTPPQDMYVFNRNELKDLKLETKVPDIMLPEGVLWQENGWTLELSKNENISCVVKKQTKPSGIFMMSKFSSQIATISFVKHLGIDARKVDQPGTFVVDYIFDKNSTYKYPTFIAKIDSTLVFYTPSTEALIKKIFVSKNLDAYKDNQFIAGVDLTGSAKAIQYLASCIDTFFPKSSL